MGEDLAEHQEFGFAEFGRTLTDRRGELGPELVVDVLHRVDPEAVDVVPLDDVGVQVDHPVDDTGVLGEEVVEPEEVAPRVALAVERRVAAVVIERHVIQPGGGLRLGVGRVGERRRVREGDRRIEFGERVGAG